MQQFFCITIYLPKEKEHNENKIFCSIILASFNTVANEPNKMTEHKKIVRHINISKL